MSTTEFASEQEALDDLRRAREEAGWPEDKHPAERAAEVAAEPDQAEMFPKGVLDGDAQVGLGDLVRPGDGQECTASLLSAEVPLRGGLIDPRKSGKVIVSYEVAKFIVVPQREGEPGEKEVEGYKVRTQLRPTFVEPAEGILTVREVRGILEELGIDPSSEEVQSLLGD